MKRIICISLIALLLFGCAAPTTTESLPTVDVDAIKKEGYDDGYAAGYAEGVASVTPAPTAEPTATPVPTETPAPTPAPLESVFIHEDDYVKIEFLNCETVRGEDKLVFRVQNKTDGELTFQSGSMSIDGEDLGSIGGSDSIAAKSSGKIRFKSYDTDTFPTLTPGRISGTIQVIDFNKIIFANKKQSYEVSFVDVPCVASSPVESSAQSPGSSDVVLSAEQKEQFRTGFVMFVVSEDAIPSANVSFDDNGEIVIRLDTVIKSGAGTDAQIAHLKDLFKKTVTLSLEGANDFVSFQSEGIAASASDRSYLGGIFDAYPVRVHLLCSNGDPFATLHSAAGAHDLQYE